MRGSTSMIKKRDMEPSPGVMAGLISEIGSRENKRERGPLSLPRERKERENGEKEKELSGLKSSNVLSFSKKTHLFGLFLFLL